MELKTEEKVKQLIEEIDDFIYTSNAHNADDEAPKNIALLCVNKQLELLRYLGSKTTKELYDDLVKQKVALQTI